MRESRLTISRRQILKSTLALAAGALALPRRAWAQELAGQEITMFSYAGPSERAYRRALLPAFEKATGARIVLAPGWWDAPAKLKASPPDQPPYDLIMTDATQGYPGIRDGLFRKIDFAKLPNTRRFAPRLLSHWVYAEGWGLPQSGPAMTLAWNKELVPGGLKQWSDLFAESLKGKIMLYNAHYMSLYTFAVAKVEMDGKPGTAKAELERNLDGVLAFARDKSAWVRYWWPTSGDAANALVQKNVSAGNCHGSAVIGPIRDGKPLDFTVPAHDRVMAPSFLVVPANTKKADVALAAIEFYARPEVQRAVVEESGGLQGCNIPAIAAELAPKFPEWARVFASAPAHFETLDAYPFELYERHQEKIKTFWERQVLRKV